MKRLLILIGMVTVIPLASAASSPGNNIRGLETAAVSPAVKQTLIRAADGLDASWTGSDAELLKAPEGGEPELWNLAMGNVLRTNPQITALGRSLGTMTSCQYTDVFLLRAALEEVQRHMIEAIRQRELTVLLRLNDLYRFLDDRLVYLTQRGAEPLAVDTNWGDTRMFEPESRPDTTTPVCAFTTDYVPPVIAAARYGCDSTVLERTLGALQSIPVPERAEKLRATLELELQGTRQMEELLRSSQVTTNELLLTEQRIEAMENGTVTTILPTESPAPPTDHAPAETGCQYTLPQGVWLRGKTGPFSLSPNDLSTLTAFRAARRAEGSVRVLPQFLTGVVDTVGNLLLNLGGNQWIESFSQGQGEQEAEIFGAGIDPVLSMERTLEPLKINTGRLASLAQDSNGIKGAVEKFVFWLRRTCLERPCNNRLDAILKILESDECFPYTSGEYLTDTADDPRAKKCLQDAGLNELVP